MSLCVRFVRDEQVCVEQKKQINNQKCQEFDWNTILCRVEMILQASNDLFGFFDLSSLTFDEATALCFGFVALFWRFVATFRMNNK